MHLVLCRLSLGWAAGGLGSWGEGGGNLTDMPNVLHYDVKLPTLYLLTIVYQPSPLLSYTSLLYALQERRAAYRQDIRQVRAFLRLYCGLFH